MRDTFMNSFNAIMSMSIVAKEIVRTGVTMKMTQVAIILCSIEMGMQRLGRSLMKFHFTNT